MPTLNEEILMTWMSEAMHPDSKLTATTAFDRVARHLFGKSGSSRIWHKARKKLTAQLYPKTKKED